VPQVSWAELAQRGEAAGFGLDSADAEMASSHPLPDSPPASPRSSLSSPLLPPATTISAMTAKLSELAVVHPPLPPVSAALAAPSFANSHVPAALLPSPAPSGAGTGLPSMAVAAAAHSSSNGKVVVPNHPIPASSLMEDEKEGSVDENRAAYLKKKQWSDPFALLIPRIEQLQVVVTEAWKQGRLPKPQTQCTIISTRVCKILGTTQPTWSGASFIRKPPSPDISFALFFADRPAREAVVELLKGRGVVCQDFCPRMVDVECHPWPWGPERSQAACAGFPGLQYLRACNTRAFSPGTAQFVVPLDRMYDLPDFRIAGAPNLIWHQLVRQPGEPCCNRCFQKGHSRRTCTNQEACYRCSRVDCPQVGRKGNSCSGSVRCNFCSATNHISVWCKKHYMRLRVPIPSRPPVERAAPIHFPEFPLLVHKSAAPSSSSSSYSFSPAPSSSSQFGFSHTSAMDQHDVDDLFDISLTSPPLSSKPKRPSPSSSSSSSSFSSSSSSSSSSSPSSSSSASSSVPLCLCRCCTICTHSCIHSQDSSCPSGCSGGCTYWGFHPRTHTQCRRPGSKWGSSEWSSSGTSRWRSH